MEDAPRFFRQPPIEHGDAEFVASTMEQVETVLADIDAHAPPVAIVVADVNERKRMGDAVDEFTRRGIDVEVHEVGIPTRLSPLASLMERSMVRGMRIVIAAAGAVPSLPSMIASTVDVPVLGVPLSVEPTDGIDRLMAVATSPAQAPVACMPINGARAAAVFASHVLTALPLAPGEPE